ncbi:MAG: 50S ribosomal protein L17 [Planctomycetota bacterium]
MRHNVKGRYLSRTSAHRAATARAVVCALFENERIITTLPKAKEYAPFAEKMITLAKKEDNKIHNFRRALAKLHNKAVVRKLFEDVAPRYKNRQGGYTRIVKLAKRRIGDDASQAILELVERKTAETPKAVVPTPGGAS